VETWKEKRVENSGVLALVLAWKGDAPPEILLKSTKKFTDIEKAYLLYIMGLKYTSANRLTNGRAYLEMALELADEPLKEVVAQRLAWVDTIDDEVADDASATNSDDDVDQ